MRHSLRVVLLVALSSPAAIGQGPAPRSFDRELLLETTSETSASVSVGDVHGDGHLDIVLAKGRHWPLNNLILRNDGKGRFRVAGTFGQPEWSTRYVTVADLDGNQRPDLVVANRSSDPANPRPSCVCLNDGKAGFPSCSPLATESATIIVAADYDGDGRVDLFEPHRDGGRNLIFWNDGTGRYAASPSKVGPERSWIRAAAAADINGDRILDLIVGDERTGVFLYLGGAGRTFDAPVALAGGARAPYAIAVADLDRDGRPDVVVGRQEARGAVFFNLGGGRVPRFRDTPWNDGKGSVYGVAIGDLDGDGWPDIAAARSDAPNAVWFNGPSVRN